MHPWGLQAHHTAETQPLEFLWLELTNQCNLRCAHCYAESGPETGTQDVLTAEDYAQLIEEAYELGCRRVQFVGGEPTLNRDLNSLIVHANKKGFEFIEVFTNLIRLPKPLIDLFKAHKVQVATSVYADTAAIHDEITTISGSFARTISNMKKLIAAGVPVRAGVIEMPQNRRAVQDTISFLRGIGVQSVGLDAVRKIGRGGSTCGDGMSELCGECAGGTLCVGPDGRVSPCIMSKEWSVGSVTESSLSDIVNSENLQQTRDAIYEHAVKPRQVRGLSIEEIVGVCTPKTCGPYSSCSPKWGPGPCQPSGCSPCLPKG